MAIPITIPRLGWNMEEGIFLGWLKKDGDTVCAGDMLFRLESEKSAEEIECHEAGILRVAPNGPKEGDTVPVGLLIGHVAAPGEELPIADCKLPIEGKKNATATAQAGEPSPVRGRVSDEIKSSPRARRVAAELGVDLAKVQGTGRSGRIREKDVRAAQPAPHGARVAELSRLRRAGVARLIKSAQSTVPVTLTTIADVSALILLRRQAAVSINDVFVKLVAMSLKQHPLLAARWADDHLVLPEKLNIGIAVDTEAGLVVPVIHDAAALSVQKIAERSRDLIERTRAGKLTSKDVQGGVFTITNLGMFGIDAFTPIINTPECAILGLGAIRRVPVFVDDKVVAREQVTLSLTFDHRVVDGAPAARFLQSLVAAIEKPTALVV